MTIILSLFVGHTAWHWMIERGENLAKFPFPPLDAAAAASLLRWLMGLVIFAGLAWLAAEAIERRAKRRSSSETPR